MSRNSKLAIVSTLISLAALAVFLLLPMFGPDTGLNLLSAPIEEGKWAMGIMVLVYIFVLVLLLDVVLCIVRAKNGKFFKTLSRSATFAMISLAMVSFSMYVINVVMYGTLKPLLHFMDPNASGGDHICHHVCIGLYVVIALILVRIIVQMFATTREKYYKSAFAGASENKPAVVAVTPAPVCECESVDAPVSENATVCPQCAPQVETNDDMRRRGGSNARAVARDRDTMVAYVEETAVFDSNDIQPVKELTLEEKVAVLIQESTYHKPMTEVEIMEYVTSKCEVETKENPLSQSRYVMYKGKAMGFFHTFRDGGWEIVARVEADFAKALTEQLDSAEYSVVPKSPKWIKLPSNTSANIVRAVVDSSLAETGIVADEHKAQESQYRKRLRDAKKNGIADVKSISESFKGVEDVEVKKAEKRNYISIKKAGKTLAFVNGKDIDFKLTVKADESRLEYYRSSGIVVNKATFPTTPGWYTIECEGNITLDMLKTILNDSYKAN